MNLEAYGSEDARARATKIREELRKRGRLLSSHAVNGGKNEVESWALSTKTVILTVRREDGGWNLWVPVSDSLSIDDTLAAIDNYVVRP